MGSSVVLGRLLARAHGPRRRSTVLDVRGRRFVGVLVMFAVPALSVVGCSSSPSTTSPPTAATASAAGSTLGSTSSRTGGSATKLDSGELRSIIGSSLADPAAASKITLVTINEATSPAVVVIGYVDDKNTGVDVCRAADSYVFSRRPDATIEVDLPVGDPAAKAAKTGYCAQA